MICKSLSHQGPNHCTGKWSMSSQPGTSHPSCQLPKGAQGAKSKSSLYVCLPLGPHLCTVFRDQDRTAFLPPLPSKQPQAEGASPFSTAMSRLYHSQDSLNGHFPTCTAVPENTLLASLFHHLCQQDVHGRELLFTSKSNHREDPTEGDLLQVLVAELHARPVEG